MNNLKRLSGEEGSLAPMGIGIFTISLALVLAIATSVSLFIFQKRLTTLAEAAVLFSAADYGSTDEFLSLIGPTNFTGIKLQHSLLADGLTDSVRACALWQSPIDSFVFRGGMSVCSHAEARAE